MSLGHEDKADGPSRDGWRERSLSGFIDVAGPLWTRKEAGGWAYGLHCGEQHLNPARRVHGGAMMTLLDHAISAVAWEAADRKPCVTVQLDCQFLDAVQAGEFAEARARVVRKTRSLLFMQGGVMVGGREVMTTQAILKVIAEA